MVNDNHSMKSQ